MSLRAALALSPLLWACSPAEPSRATANTAEPAPQAAEIRPTRNVLDETLKALGVSRREGVLSARELRENRGLMPGEALVAEPDPATATDGTAAAGTTAAGATAEELEGQAREAALDPEMVELRDGLVGMVLGDARYLETALQDVAASSTELTAALTAGLRDTARSAEELKVLAQFARSAPSLTSSGALADLTLSHDDPGVRAFAAWALIPAAPLAGSGAVIPVLLRRLKYEKDTQALIWAARALAAHGNLAGLTTLSAIARDVSVEGAAIANQQLYEVVRIEVAREEVSAEDADALMRGWSVGAKGRTALAPDDLRGLIWQLISDLSGEHFQLRGVDDARYILSRLGPWASEELGLALEDEDDYVRLHVTQVLERMGPRGSGSTASLVLALHDRSDAVAGAAAEALASVAPAACLPPLLQRLGEAPPHEVRVAIIRAAGRATAPPSALLLETFRAPKAPTDLRLAAATGLLRAELPGAEQAEVLGWLADAMTRRFGDPAGAEALLGEWVASLEGERGAASRAAWVALGPQQAIIHTAEQAATRRGGRADLVRAQLQATDPD